MRLAPYHFRSAAIGWIIALCLLGVITYVRAHF